MPAKKRKATPEISGVALRPCDSSASALFPQGKRPAIPSRASLPGKVTKKSNPRGEKNWKISASGNYTAKCGPAEPPCCHRQRDGSAAPPEHPVATSNLRAIPRPHIPQASKVEANKKGTTRVTLARQGATRGVPSTNRPKSCSLRPAVRKAGFTKLRRILHPRRSSLTQFVPDVSTRPLCRLKFDGFGSDGAD